MERIRKGYWTAIGMIVVWSGFTTLMLVVFPVPLFRIFIPDDHVLQTGVSYLRIMGYSQILMCLEITSSGAFRDWAAQCRPRWPVSSGTPPASSGCIPQRHGTGAGWGLVEHQHLQHCKRHRRVHLVCGDPAPLYTPAGAGS